MSYNPNQAADPSNQQPPQPYGQPPYYNPQPPVSLSPQRKKSLRWLWITLAIIVLAIAGGVTALVLVVNNSPAKIAVQNYYSAVEKQDYATAYTYLYIQTLTSDGRQQAASSSAYAQAAESADQAQGKVTAYSITGIEISSSTGAGNTATITLNVTRGSKTQAVQVQLQQVGNDWKIVGIDNI